MAKLPSEVDSQDILKIAKEAATTLFGRVISTTIYFVYSVVIARALGANLIGLYFLGMDTVFFLSIASILGLDQGMLRYVPLFIGQKNNRFVKGTILFALKIAGCLSLLFGFLLFIASPVISKHVFHNLELEKVLMIFSIALPFICLSNILLYSIQGFRRLKYRVYVENLLLPISRFIITLLFLVLGWKLLSVLSAHLISVVLGFLLAFYFLTILFPPLIRKMKYETDRKGILHFSLPMYAKSLLGTSSVWINTWLLGMFKSSAEVGIYKVAARTATLGTMILVSFNSIFAPTISELHGQNQIGKLETLFKITTKWTITCSLFVYLPVMIFSSPILGIYGKEFVIAAVPLVLLCLAQIINSGVGSSGYMVAMSGRSDIVLINQIITVTLVVVLSVVLIPKYGMLGAAVANGVSIILVNIAQLTETYLLMQIHPYKFAHLKPVLAGTIACGISIFTKTIIQLNLVFRVVIFFAVFIFFLVILGIDREDLIIFNGIKKKFSRR